VDFDNARVHMRRRGSHKEMPPGPEPGPAASRDPSIGVIALVPDRWGDIVMPRHQVIARLAKHFPVVWLEPPRSWRDYVPLFGARAWEGDSWSEPVDGLHVLAPGWRHPSFHRPSWLADFSFRSRLVAARRRLLELGARRIALYVWRDEFAAALDLVGFDFCCYHIDDEYTFSDEERPIPEREMSILRRADQVIVHSSALLRKKGGINPRTVLIHNGVAFDAFSEPRPEPPDMRNIPHPRIGYAGVIKKQLDLACIARLARRMPSRSFVFVGPVLYIAGKEEVLADLEKLPNVFMLGEKPAQALPQYVQHFDVCMMCYEVNDYTKYIYPLKLNEYLATGLPVVSSSIESVMEHQDVVTVARSDDEFAAAIEQSLAPAAMSADAKQARRKAAKENDWDVLTARIAALFREGMAGTTAPLSVSDQAAIRGAHAG
jgi:glycosyltransferase involved in cell wall biosynthesis